MSTQMIGFISERGLSFQARPRYRRKCSRSSVHFGGSIHRAGVNDTSVEPRGMLVPSLAPARSVRETMQEVKVVQIWEDMMKSCEMWGKELLNGGVINPSDLCEWLKAKNSNDGPIIGVGLPCYSLFRNLLYSIESGSVGLMMGDGIEVTALNAPQDRLLDWFFHPVMVLKEQIKVIALEEGEVRYLEKLIIFGGNTERMESWKNGSFKPEDALRAAQIQGMARRMIGMVRSVSKLPTYRRRFRHVVKALSAYSIEKNGPVRTGSVRSVNSI